MNTDRFLNLTPHAIHVCNADGHVVATFPPSGKVARCIQSPQTDMPDLEGFPVASAPSYGAVDLGYTSEELGALGNPHIIVSSLCLDGAADIYSGRVVAPDAGNASVVRNDKGQIVGVRRFVAAESPKARHAQALAAAADTPFFMDFTTGKMVSGLTAAADAASKGHVVHQGYDSWRLWPETKF
jgi:hypothetical protein